MQPHQNSPSRPTADPDSAPIASPLIRTSFISRPVSFRSPMTSAQKRKLRSNKANDENVEPDDYNPFSGPTFLPSHHNRGKHSPGGFSPSKIKQESVFGDNHGFHLVSRPFESPFTQFCKDLTCSPNLGSLQTLTYSPAYDNSSSPTFAGRNITQIDFSNPNNPNNPNKMVMLKSHRGEISIETDDHPDLHNHQRYGMITANDDESLHQTTFMNFLAKKSIYNGPMVPSQTRNNEVYSQRAPQESSLGYKEITYPPELQTIPEEDTDTMRNCLPENYTETHSETYADKCPRTPSPTAAHHNKKFKLNNINSFSGQGRRHHKQSGASKKEKTPGGFNEGSESSLTKRRFINEDEEEGGDEGTSRKQKKKKVCCNCKKSRCLKLYCDCFGRGQPCVGDCNCNNCLNTEAHFAERQEAMVSILDRNPSAFKPKVDESPEKAETQDNIGRVRHVKGCNCKKSGCQKRYCECFQAGVKCSELCKCENCQNMDSCCRFKRAQNYGFLNFGPQDSLTMNMIYSESKSMNHNSRHYYPDEEIYSYPEDEISHQYQIRPRLMHSYQDPSFYSEIPQNKRRKLDVSTSEFTPKKMLVFPKEETKEISTKAEPEYNSFRDKKKGLGNQYRMSFSQTEKKKVDNADKTSEYTPSPGKPLLSGRRTKRNIRPFSHFNPDEYELRK